MPRLLVLASACLLANSIACAFDASGGSRGLGILEEADDDGDDGTDDGDTPAPEPEPEPDDDADAGDDRPDDAGDSADDGADGEDTGSVDTSVLEAGEVDDGSADGEATDDGGEATDDAGAEVGTDDEGGMLPDCPADVFELHWAESADLVDPMQLLVADEAVDEPDVATSMVAEEGSVTFALHFECPGEYAIWGLVWDYYPGAYASDDPDSFYVGVGGPEPTWRYGCDTAVEESGLSWQRLQALQSQPCDAVPVVLSVAEPGDVELTFRNREEGESSKVAGLSAIVVASDADADPYELYTPY